MNTNSSGPCWCARWTRSASRWRSICKLPPGRTEPREGIVQDAPLLKKFPDQIDRKFAGEDDKLYDLSEYDVIVAFDPDWHAVDRRPNQAAQAVGGQGRRLHLRGRPGQHAATGPAGGGADGSAQADPATAAGDAARHPPGRSQPRHERGLAARLLRGDAGHGVFEAGGRDRRQGAAAVPGRLEGLLRPAPARRQRQPRLL